MVILNGGCHCTNIQFQVQFEGREIIAWDCNCSICLMKKNTHCIIPSKDFKLKDPEIPLTKYTFNTHTAQHWFCPKCGVQAFYVPRSNPDGFAVTIACIKEDDLKNSNIIIKVQKFDGKNWDQEFAESNISQLSK
ncbi:Mss4-like protein [Globomyces pollinis-pini]|nr:Mss4-like protein [Globomyces pollinis-pini]